MLTLNNSKKIKSHFSDFRKFKKGSNCASKTIIVILLFLNSFRKVIILLVLNNSKKISDNFTDLLVFQFSPAQSVRSHLARKLSLSSTCVTCAMPLQWLPSAFHPHFTASATDLRECFLLSAVFYLALLPAFFKASLGPAVRPQSQMGFMLKFET